MKIIKYFIISSLLLIIGIMIGLLCNKNAWLNLDSSKTYGAWEVLYYFFSIIGSLGTLAAVVVALGKDYILRILFHPDLNVEFSEEFGISEDIDTEQQNPETETYNCELKISNKGSVVARSCEVLIEQVGYADKKGRSIKYLKDYQNNASRLVWESNHVDIPDGLSKCIRLFHIDSPGSVGTPGSNNSNCHLELNGFKLKDNKSLKGYWEISYYIGYDNGEHKQFKVSIDWNGEWKTRKTEMKDVLHIKII